MIKDIKSMVKVLQAISPVIPTDNTAQVSSAIDLQAANGCMFAIATGTLADTNATFAVEVTEGDTSGGSFTAVGDDDLVGTEAGAGFQFDDDDEVRTIGYVGSKRFVKITITPSGNTGNAPMSAVAVLLAKKQPNDSQES